MSDIPWIFPNSCNSNHDQTAFCLHVRTPKNAIFCMKKGIQNKNCPTCNEIDELTVAGTRKDYCRYSFSDPQLSGEVGWTLLYFPGLKSCTTDDDFRISLRYAIRIPSHHVPIDWYVNFMVSPMVGPILPSGEVTYRRNNTMFNG